MSIKLYQKTSIDCSTIITKKYSTSFSFGIKMLAKRHQNPIYAIYGYVRVADEIVDTFHGFDKKSLLDEFERDTWLAIERKISTNPVLESFQKVVNDYQIDRKLISAFLESMKMDLYNTEHDSKSYEEYIYGSAEVVGLMCLRIFCNGDTKLYEELKGHAKSLGAAFQKVNFLRDMNDDFSDKGRVYFPNVNLGKFDFHLKKNIENDIQKDFDDALIGIKKLPKDSRIGVYVAYKYYIKLFKKIKSTKVEKILKTRIRINNVRKILILSDSFARHKLNFL